MRVPIAMATDLISSQVINQQDVQAGQLATCIECSSQIASLDLIGSLNGTREVLFVEKGVFVLQGRGSYSSDTV